MQPDPDKSFEARLDRALKQLPPLTAPRTLLPRVMAAIERRAELPWYRLGWSGWPRGLQYVSLASMLVFLTGLSFGLWQVSQSTPAAEAGDAAGLLFNLLTAIGSTCWALIKAGLVMLSRLDPVYLALIVLAAAVMAFSCVGVGTLYYRFAWITSTNGNSHEDHPA